LSASARAVAQRNRKATFNDEEKAKSQTGAADRAALAVLKKKIQKEKRWEDMEYRRAQVEILDQKRYEQKKSCKL
jgi:hypothetical protein